MTVSIFKPLIPLRDILKSNNDAAVGWHRGTISEMKAKGNIYLHSNNIPSQNAMMTYLLTFVFNQICSLSDLLGAVSISVPST